MATQKRQRKKVGRQARQQAIAAERRRQSRRRTFIVTVVVVALVALVAGLTGAFNSGSSSKKVSTASAAACPKADGSSPKTVSFAKAPPNCIDPSKTYTATMKTSQGELTISLDPKIAPKTVNNFVFLARYHFFDGVTFHRIVPDFVIQGGDPKGDGTGGPGYTIPDELPQQGQYKIGSVVMANTGQPNSGGSQFFIITGQQGVQLPPQYSLFGQVTAGIDTVQKIAALGVPGAPNGTPKEKVTIDSVTITEG
jgi:cyclophilin family peptidyl-prolyl cis-trans isomerase